MSISGKDANAQLVAKPVTNTMIGAQIASDAPSAVRPPRTRTSGTVASADYAAKQETKTMTGMAANVENVGKRFMTGMVANVGNAAKQETKTMTGSVANVGSANSSMLL